MLGVVARRQRLVDQHQLEPDEMQAPALQPGDHLADEAALNPIGFHQDERAFHGH